MTETTSTGNLSLLFIPDISGFTKFVNGTEISHSQHIIAELLELIIDSNQLKFETVSNSVTEDKRVYWERVTNPPLMKEGVTFFIMEPENNGTRLTMEYHIIPLPLAGWLFKPLLNSGLKKNVNKALSSIKHFSENEFNPDSDLN